MVEINRELEALSLCARCLSLALQPGYLIPFLLRQHSNIFCILNIQVATEFSYMTLYLPVQVYLNPPGISLITGGHSKMPNGIVVEVANHY